MMLFQSCSASNGIDIEYQVEIVTYSSAPEVMDGAFALKVVAYDSHLDSIKIIERDIENIVLPNSCELENLSKPDSFIGGAITYPVMANAMISELVTKYLPADGQMGPDLGSCFTRADVRLQSMTYNAFRFIPPDVDGNDTEILFQFYCLFDEQTQEVIFVDSIVLPEGFGPYGPFKKGFFDSNGRYFYYSKDGVVKRFDIENLHIDVLSQGSVPVIPWNSEEVAVYSEEERLFKLLSKDGSVKSTVKLKIRPRIQSVFAIDSTTFVCASYAPIKAWHSPQQEVFIIDFAKGVSRKLLDRFTVIKIRDAKKVN